MCRNVVSRQLAAGGVGARVPELPASAVACSCMVDRRATCDRVEAPSNTGYRDNLAHHSSYVIGVVKALRTWSPYRCVETLRRVNQLRERSARDTRVPELPHQAISGPRVHDPRPSFHIQPI